MARTVSDAGFRAQIPPGCNELVNNGGFEVQGPGWTILASERPAIYTSERAFAGQYSMRLGITGQPNLQSESIIEQSITLPDSATSIILSFHYYPIYDSAPDGNDLQFVDIYNALTNQFIARPIEVQRNDRTWLLVQYDLTAQAGQRVKLYFRTLNDGSGARTAMYIDNVSILACDATPGTPTSTATATTQFPTNTPTATTTAAVTTPTATPTTINPTATSPSIPTAPVGCINSLVNGGFEGNGFWVFGQDPIPPRYAGDQAHGGTRAVLQGNLPQLGLQNILSYSSVRQLVELPYVATTAQLRWWQLSGTEEIPIDNPSRFQDRQEVILLNAHLETIAVLRRVRRNDGVWQENVLDLTPYIGKSFYVYFNVYNDGAGGRTWMYLDDVSLDVCYPPASPTPIPPLTTTATATPTATFVPPAPTETPTATETFVPPLSTSTATAEAVQVATATAPIGALVDDQTIDLAATATANALATEFAIIQTATAQVFEGTATDLSTSIAASPPPATPRVGPVVPAPSLTWWDRLGTLAILISIPVFIVGLAVFLWSLYVRNGRETS